jgi:tRNA dimethylallyltransferase
LRSKRKSFVLIVGPTGVGKSTTAITLAERIGGEIINCDSMQVYRGFDIGTDKPSAEERARVPHHLLDIVESPTQFTAAEFMTLAQKVIRSILGREKIPFVVGGTGLYVKTLLDGLFPGPGRHETLRADLKREASERGLPALWERLNAVDPAYARKVGRNDKMRIIRGLEVYALTGSPISEHFRNTRSPLQDFHSIQIGLKLEKEELVRRIEERVERMFERGLVAEVRGLLASGVSESSPPFHALGYEHVLQYLKGRIRLEEAIFLTKVDTRRYAKRQMTWFRKMTDVRWFSPADLEGIFDFIKQNLI